MAKYCYFCGKKTSLFGQNAWCQVNGYDLCRSCANEWKLGGRVEYLLKDGDPILSFAIEKATMNDIGGSQYEGNLLFFQHALAFLAYKKSKKRDPAIVAVAGWFSGGLGAIITGMIQDKMEKASTERAVPSTTIREAIDRALGYVVIKRGDIRQIRFEKWKGGLIIDTACMSYKLLQLDESTFNQYKPRIQGWVGSSNK
jgi:hypothetical protein